jgi:2-phosphosulfolactate phosphatase
MATSEIIFFPHPHTIQKQKLKKATVVVFDVLRATTSMIFALRGGCSRILPCSTIGQAKMYAKQLDREKEAFVLAGERKGKRISGFDLGNSPQEFMIVKNKTVVMTTSNGTQAITAVSSASKVLIACLNNIAAVGSYLVRNKCQRLVLVGAGAKKQESPEDTLAAGKLIQWLIGKSFNCSQLNATALLAYEIAVNANNNVEAFLRQTKHGLYLKKIGFKADIGLAAQMNNTRKIGVLTATGIRSLIL